MGRVSTLQIQTPPQRQRKRTSLPSSDSTRSQRRRLCKNNPDVVPFTLIPLVDRLSQKDLRNHNQQAYRQQQTRLRSGYNSNPPLREPSQKRAGSPSSIGTRSQIQFFSSFPSAVLITLIPLKERLSQYNLHGHNQQANDNHVFGDAYPTSPAPNSSLFTFQNIRLKEVF